MCCLLVYTGTAEKASTIVVVYSCGKATYLNALKWTSRSGNRYVVVFQDYLTKWLEVFPVVDRTARTSADCLVKLVSRHGVPAKIIHDRALEFLSDVLQDTAALLGVQQLPTSGRHPQTDSLVEGLNRTLKKMLSKLVQKKGNNWDELLDLVLMTYCTSPHSSAEESLFFLLYCMVEMQRYFQF